MPNLNNNPLYAITLPDAARFQNLVLNEEDLVPRRAGVRAGQIFYVDNVHMDRALMDRVATHVQWYEAMGFAGDPMRLSERVNVNYKLTGEEINKMKKDLMELVEDCRGSLALTESKLIKAAEQASFLRGAGFTQAAKTIEEKISPIEKRTAAINEKYIIITKEKIQVFLNKKATEYNMQFKKELIKGGWAEHHLTANLENQPANDLNYLSHAEMISKTCFSGNVGFDRVGKFVWSEVPVGNYKGVPPDSAINKLIEVRAKNIFDEFTVASVSNVPDPLLLGRLSGTSDRFFLHQWGDDVCLDDII